eukprot:CAMPEP_0118969272 /NCGR_PEP_ID=MMETSP1173-20130426/6380_1 /TAXON_ID=1034831 /ORGANISM="Rhizochromulina marina cf, Strain CCMP1243" /LENGTH=85 /DNA_ID=CAMNT_0006918493 /DNA_START=431 /DNA_END=685 /DNA_ORIENTATION=+
MRRHRQSMVSAMRTAQELVVFELEVVVVVTVYGHVAGLLEGAVCVRAKLEPDGGGKAWLPLPLVHVHDGGEKLSRMLHLDVAISS